MPHSFSWRCSSSPDKSNNRFRHIFLNPLGCFFFRSSTNFPYHDDGICFRIFVKRFQHFNKVCTDYGVTTEIGTNFIEVLKAFNEDRSEEHTSELQSRFELVCRLL